MTIPREIPARSANGYLMTLLGLGLLATGLLLLIRAGQPLLGIPLALAGALVLAGLYMLAPNQTAVLTLFGAYIGSDRAAGLLVDSVSDILSVEDSSIQPTPDVASNLARMFVRGVIAMDGRMISVISLDNVLPATELEAA